VTRRALLGGRKGQRRMMGVGEKQPDKKLSQVSWYRYVPERDGGGEKGEDQGAARFSFFSGVSGVSGGFWRGVLQQASPAEYSVFLPPRAAARIFLQTPIIKCHFFSSLSPPTTFTWHQKHAHKTAPRSDNGKGENDGVGLIRFQSKPRF
jgi:hypothetical protein